MAPPDPRDPSQADTVALDSARSPTLDAAVRSASGSSGAVALKRRDDRYRAGAVIGRGGMGEVAVALDGDIGREVAIKRMRVRDASPEAVARFLREARIQARLEHPAIVPVHDLGADPDGSPFFAMKRLAGTTLAEVLERADDERFPRARLLRAFAEVCLAIEFAHTRGVVHRDLKPGNIMLGDFGEVYVLDWGIARVAADAPIASDVTTLDPAAPAGVTPAPVAVDGNAGTLAATHAGAVMGTPGYMPPEQARGEPVDRRADIYALGAILFEIVTRTQLHPRGAAALASTFAGAEVRADVRGIADYPPELARICARATATAPADRHATARELGDAVQRYLDGDRDLQHRRELAEAHADAARLAREAGDRPRAMREAGRALALDPTHALAAQIVSSLVLEPPREVPDEVRARMRELDRDQSQRQSAIGIVGFAVYLAFSPVFVIVGVRDWTWFAVTYGLVVLGLLNAWRTKTTRVPTLAHIVIALVLNAAVVLAFSRVLGPYLVVGSLATAVISSISTYPLLLPYYPLVFGVLSTVVWGPPLLEWLGVLARTSTFSDGALVVHSNVVAIGPSTDLVMVLFGLGLLAFAGLFARRLALDARRVQEQVELQAWHLRQLVS